MCLVRILECQVHLCDPAGERENALLDTRSVSSMLTVNHFKWSRNAVGVPLCGVWHHEFSERHKKAVILLCLYAQCLGRK